MKIQFRDLGRQYKKNKKRIDEGIKNVIKSSQYIHGDDVVALEDKLADYVGVKHCISCANGTDALQLALMAWGIGEGDAVFVPDFTFFSSGEVVSAVGATPVFVDVSADTFNIDPVSLKHLIKRTIKNTNLNPKAVIAVDLFGQPADYPSLKSLCKEYGLRLLEDGAQGFGGRIGERKSCSFGDISTTSFFPSKPLGCYGDGGAIFTDIDEWAALIRSFCVHGKGIDKYENVRIGMNSRLDSIQAAVLNAKFPNFVNQELDDEQTIAQMYSEQLNGVVKIPTVADGYYSSWAQYTIRLKNSDERDALQSFLKINGIPTMVYYRLPMHKQIAFTKNIYYDEDYNNSESLSETVLSIPFHPYLDSSEIEFITSKIKLFIKKQRG